VADAAPAVLVHGAWHGPWCWERVVELLEPRGIEAHLVDLPSMDAGAGRVTTVHDDAAALRQTLDALDRPAVVVGHSYGGMVITEGAAGHANVKHLVYLAAFMPDAGESMIALLMRHPNPELMGAVRAGADGRTTLDPSSIGPGFYNDCDAETVSWAASRMRSMLSDGNAPVRDAAWRTAPSTYVVCSGDRAILPELQRAMSAHAAHVIEWDASHSPFASQPDRVAALIERLARS
jgi:pimeloyl-ACP methyl ester carboxylesterase